MVQTRRIIALAAFLAVLSTGASFAESSISYFEGEVLVVRGSSRLDADYGLPLLAGDSVQTGASSLAILDIEGRGTLKLREDTLVALDDLGVQARVSLDRGGLFSKIRRLSGRGYEVRTPGVVAGVRGTEFFVAYGRTVEETPDLWLCVNEGSVEVALEGTGESLLVKEGEGITIPAGNRLTDPQFYAWTQELNWNVDPSSGSVLDETNLDGAYADLRDFDYD